jgi:hypothetical protein
MGMFDYIKTGSDINVPIPEEMKFLSKFEFQTKSLDNTLSVYLIDNDHHFYLTDVFFEEDDQKNTKVKEKNKIDYHGKIVFGCYEQTDLIDYLADFEAKFTDGVLQDIKLLNYKKIEHDSLELRREKLLERQRKENRKFSTKLKRNITSILSRFDLRLKLDTPKIVLFYKPDYQEKKYGLFLDNTGFYLKKTEYLSEFVFKILGFGFVLSKFKKLDNIFEPERQSIKTRSRII